MRDCEGDFESDPKMSLSSVVFPGGHLCEPEELSWCERTFLTI